MISLLRIALLAGLVSLLAGLVGCGESRKPAASRPFFPNLPALRATPLAIERLEADDTGLELLIDQGIRGVADVSDIFRETSTGRIVVGGDRVARPILESRLKQLPASARKAWEEHAAAFRTGNGTAPTSEGILSKRTPSILVPTIPKTDPIRRSVVPVLSAMTNVIETRSDVPVTKVQTEGGPWLQDFLTAFDDGSFGIPPHLDRADFQRAVSAVHERAADFMIGGKALTMGKVISTPLRDLRSQGRRFRQLRAFIEGGNVVFATGAGGRVRAIVGSHTLRLTQSVYGLDDDATVALIAEDFLLEPGDIVVVPQPDYHIDLYLRAAGPGKIFLADLQQGLAMLERLILASATSQRDALEALRQRAARSRAHAVGQTLSRKLEDTKAQLEAAGFEVIAYPSIYYSYFNTAEYENVDGRFAVTPDARLYVHVNTMNGRYVTGSDGRVMSFVLSSGYDAIDRSIETFENNHGVDEVYFLGQRLAAPKFWGNQVLLSAAGVGCLTNL